MKWDPFWEDNKKEKYKETLSLLETYFDTFTACKVQLTEMENNATSFSKEGEKSKRCKFLSNRLYITNLLQDLICADWTGDCEKHLRTVEKWLPII